ncbi:MAG: hypothetical protein NPIRA04_00090 [Nitrospirales bacterium]|nr:MAG: hypothetical protein NPIRA04_00090 [Nitrospirales bacterium]
MNEHAHDPQHIQITEALIHVYLLLTQYLDHIVDERNSPELSNQDIETQLEKARTTLQTFLAANPVVQAKVGKESDRILSEATQVRKEGQSTKNMEKLTSERNLLQTKIVTLTDLVAVFRAI